MPRLARPHTHAPTYIDPDRVYTRRGMHIATGLSQQKVYELRRWGIECRRFFVGRRCFYRGTDIISFLEAAAAEEIRQQAVVTEDETE
jgi:hypothetical protein